MAQHSWCLKWEKKKGLKRKTCYFKSREENLAKTEILALNFKSCSYKNIWIYSHEMCSVQFSQFSHSVVPDSATPWIIAYQASLSITNSQSLLKLMSIESVMPSSHPIILPFPTVHGVLKARILKWFAILFSSGPHSVRTLHHDHPSWVVPHSMA